MQQALILLDDAIGLAMQAVILRCMLCLVIIEEVAIALCLAGLFFEGHPRRRTIAQDDAFLGLTCIFIAWAFTHHGLRAATGGAASCKERTVRIQLSCGISARLAYSLAAARSAKGPLTTTYLMRRPPST